MIVSGKFPSVKLFPEITNAKQNGKQAQKTQALVSLSYNTGRGYPVSNGDIHSQGYKKNRN